ncbi:MAG: nucleoside kinase [Clostridia bacterium]
MQILLDGQSLMLEEGARYLDAAEALYQEGARRVLGVRVGGLTLPLEAQVLDGQHATGLTVYTEEGRRIYERSLRFVLLLAMRALYPHARVRLENATHLGLYLTIQGETMSESSAEAIAQAMREIIARDLPYEKTVITRTEAIELFRAEGEMDKVRLLTYRPYEHFQLYRCEGMLEYFYGEMAPSTGYTQVFALRLHSPGLELQLPNPENPQVPAPFHESPMLMKTFAETSGWARILGCSNLADLNEMTIHRSLREFIRVNEALHEKSISDVADAFVASGAQLILIAGPSSSGKTTFAHRLSIQLRVRGLKPVKVSLDDYYLDHDVLPLEEDGRPDLERLETLDVPLFNRQLSELLRNAPVDMPTFDFSTGKRALSTHRMQISPDQPIIVEGIHALNDRLTREIPRARKFLIYVSALTTVNLDDHNRVRTTELRLLRRMVRDYQFRGASCAETMDMWDSVRNGERNYIFPYQEHADVMFNTTLLYEVAVLKKYAYPMLMAITPESPHYTRAHRLIKFLNYVQSADVEDEIPINSILREFIGGCCFYREED